MVLRSNCMSVVVLLEQLCPAEIMSKPGRLEGDQASVRLFRSIAIPRCSRFLLVLYLLALIGRFSLCASAAETSALPAISGFSPVSGSPGTLVILSGSNLLQVTS